MSGRRSRDKSARTERPADKVLRAVVAKVLQAKGCVEVKARATGFAQLYDWLKERDVLSVKTDRREQVARTATETVMLPTAARP